MSNIKVGIIGGTGLNDPKILLDKIEKKVTTPYGEPSSALTIGKIDGVDVVVLARHGSKHGINPSQINYRANIHALKEEGCNFILGTNACGSLRAEYKKGDLCVVDQFIDRTFKRENSFYNGLPSDPEGVLHIPMGDPFCEPTRKVMIEAIKELGFEFHEKGTIVINEGPRFSSRAESKMFRIWGGDLIGMTIVPEVCLAKEAGMSYTSVCMVTDYDAWKEDEPPVTTEEVLSILKSNADKAKQVLIKTVSLLGKRNWDDLIKQNKDSVKNSLM